jgi:hypothetical protein
VSRSVQGKFSRGLRATVVLSLAIALGASAVQATLVSASSDETTPTGLSRVLDVYRASDVTRGIATFDALPTAGAARTLRGFGLAVQRMRNVPWPSSRVRYRR